MRYITALLFIVLLPLLADARDLDRCTAPPDSPVKELTNDRIRAASERVLEKSRLSGRFALCEYPGTLPRIVLVRMPHGDVTVVFVPQYTGSFSDDALDGMFGHEYGHVPYWFSPLKGVDDEKRADKQGKAWVGGRAMLAFLAALKQEAHRAPILVQPLWHAEMNERIDSMIIDD